VSLKTETCSALAAALGLPVTEPTEQGRRLGEHRLLPKFVKGRPQAFEDIHLANLTAASMMRSPSRRAHIDVHHLAETELTSATFAKIESVRAKIADLVPGLSPLLVGQHSFLEGLAALYGMARRAPDFLEQCMFNTSIEIDHLRGDGAIYLEIEDPHRPGDLIFCDALEYAAPKPLHRGSLSIVSRLPARALLPVALAADRGA
jgi:hypothetical protein